MIGSFIDNNYKYKIGMWVSLDPGILINITDYNADLIIKCLSVSLISYFSIIIVFGPSFINETSICPKMPFSTFSIPFSFAFCHKKYSYNLLAFFWFLCFYKTRSIAILCISI